MLIHAKKGHEWLRRNIPETLYTLEEININWLEGMKETYEWYYQKTW